MYVLRYSPNIHNDIQRGWSAWMGGRYASIEAMLDNAPEISEFDVAEAWEEWTGEDRATFAWHYIENVMGWTNVAVDPHTNEVCLVHHEGLSVYNIDAETLADAVAEGKAIAERMGASYGFGVATVGRVSIAADLGNSWYLLECEDTRSED